MTTHLSTRRSALLGKLATAAAAVAVLAVVGMTPALADGGHHGGPDRDWHGGDRGWHGHEWRGHEWRREAWYPRRPYFYGGYYNPYYAYAPPPAIYVAPY